jgi:deoxyribonuclease-4
MKIYLGPAGIPTVSKGGSTLDGIKTVKDLGLNSMEIEFVRGVKMGNDLAKQAGKLAKDLNISLSIHAPYFINLCNPAKSEESEKRILQSCERAFYLGAKTVVFHPGYYGGLAKEKAYQLVKKSCSFMASYIKNKGWDVFLGLETTGKVSQFGTLDENIRISQEVKGCVPVVDWSHIFARNVGKINYREVIQKLEDLGFDHYHTHFSGIEYTIRGERNHMIIDHNKPPFKPLAEALLKSKLKSITIISESPILEQDSLKMKKIFESLGYRF